MDIETINTQAWKKKQGWALELKVITIMKMMYILQLIYIVPGQEKIFDQFEAIAIPIIGKYHGKLLLRVRPDDNSFIEHHMDKPYEMHLVEFESQQDFENFSRDEERKKFLRLKEQSIKTSILIRGSKM